LLKLAAQAQELVLRISNESDAYRKAGRLIRLGQFPLSDLTEEELVAVVDALSDANEQPSTGQLTGSPLLLKSAIALFSYFLWVGMRNEKYLFDEPSEEQVSELMSVWRERVCGVLKKWGQDVVISFTSEEYANELIGFGASEEDADRIANGLSAIFGGTTRPS
jgi:hypothetical protein